MTPLALVCSCFAASLSLAAPPQEPRAKPSLPPPVRVEGAAVEQVDVTTVNIDWENVTIADLPRLARLPGLRRLQINPHGDGAAAWRNVTPDELAPVCALPALEDLTLPFCAHLSPEHLGRLAKCERLASVLFLNEILTLDAATAGALARWPALRSLRLSLIQVKPAGLAGLAQVRGLEVLELELCRGLDAECVAALAGLVKLRPLTLSGLGRPDMLARMQRRDATPSWALTAAAMRQIAALPALQELRLEECTLEPGLLKGLSPRLRALRLDGHDVDVQALHDVRGHGSLRALELREAGATDDERGRFRKEVADLLGTLHLERFRWYGTMSTDVCQAIAGLADLRELAVPCDAGLGFLTALPKLERLELWPRTTPNAGNDGTDGHPTASEFAALRASKSLRSVAHHDTKLPAAIVDELRKALGPKIELQLVD